MRLDNEIKTILSRQSDQIFNESQFLALQKLAARHTKYGVERDSPVRVLLALVGDKWSTLVLGTLEGGTCRYTVLRELIGALSYEHEISHRVLTSKLRSLERAGLISRRVMASIPPRVDYSLTSLGISFLAVVEPLVNWAESHYQDIKTANASFDLAPPEE